MSVLKTDGADLVKLREQYEIIEDKWLDSSVGVVAVYDAYPRPHFAAYIGATEGESHKDEMWLIAWKGNKLDERTARAIFPYIKHPYKER